MEIIKRSGEKKKFDKNKILDAVKKANKEVLPAYMMDIHQMRHIADKAEEKAAQLGHTPNIEEVQDIVIFEIMKQQAYEVAKAYTEYRLLRMLARKNNSTDDAIFALVENRNQMVKEENSNKNPTVASTQRDYIAGEVSKDLTWRIILPEDIKNAHDLGILHFHDADYFIQPIHNCDLINLQDMLTNGTVISGSKIDPPKSFRSAANIATQIVAQVASSQYGGQTFSLAHLAPFVEVARKKWRKRVTSELQKSGIDATEDQINTIVEARVDDEIKDGIQTIQYQLLTLMTTNGQTPFVSMNMDLNEAANEQEKKDLAKLIEEVFRQRIQGIKNEKDVWVTPTFPKLLYVLDEDNVREDSEYGYLTYMAAQCTAKRMVPDYISAKKMRELKGDVYPCMGCRSFLTPDRFTDNGIENIAKAKNYKPGKHRYYGRFNQGVVTLNLVDVACSSNRDMEKFWEIFDERLELCHKALRLRHERLLGTPSDTAPILWQHGALARLDKHETIDPLLYEGYSTISLGYAGLYEMTKYMTGMSHTDDNGGKEFALNVMKYMNDKCAQWKADENIDYSLYGTPIESTTYRFARKLQERFGIIEDVTSHEYITNSYHVNVRENIDAFTKLKFESEFQALSPGGCISYIEVPNMQDNIPAVMDVIEFIYENIMYAELNTKSDFCMKCRYDGEMEIVEDDAGRVHWRCPNCGNEDEAFLNVTRRTCGYLGAQFWNQGRTKEIRDRVIHLSPEAAKGEK